MKKLAPFTAKRLTRFVDTFRHDRAQLPTLKDFAEAGFDETCVEQAEKQKLIEKFYVNLTNGTVVKGYKVRQN